MPKECLSARCVSLRIGVRLTWDYLALYQCAMVLDCWSSSTCPQLKYLSSTIDILTVHTWPKLYGRDPVIAVFIHCLSVQLESSFTSLRCLMSSCRYSLHAWPTQCLLLFSYC